MEYQVALTRKADQDLIRIWKHIARNNPSAATSFCLELSQQAYSLKDFPGRSNELYVRPGVRKVPYKNYLIFYRVIEIGHRVEILRFWHAAQDQKRLRLREETTAAYATTAESTVPAVAQQEA